MRRIMLIVGLAVTMSCATAGSAAAAVTGLDLGGDPEQYIVLSNQNRPALQGPRVAFLANVACTAGQRVGVIVTARQSGSGAIGQGGGGGDCTGRSKQVVIVLERLQGSPLFRFENQLSTEGFGVTDIRTRQLNDIRFDQSTLQPADVSSFLGTR